ncbi:MAG: hypothetical protein ACREE9_18910 [Stellaceae bacterium]
MTIRIGLIGIGAGAAAALLFASLTTGSLLSVLLFYLAPLPMMIAGIGWSHWAALIGAVFGALAIASLFGWVFLFAFLASVGLPAWWLGYLAMLARPVSIGNNGAAPALEWYPPGRLVMWAAILAAAVVVVAIPNFGIDAGSFRTGMHHALARLLSAESGELAGRSAGDLDSRAADRVIAFLVAAVPPAAAVLATVTNVVNLWLAARIVKFSGRLARPWPQIASLTLPRPLMGALAVAGALCFLSGMLGILASVAAAGLLMAYGVLGFAVLHTITQGQRTRGFLLGGTYAAVMVFGWPILALCLLGLIESTVELRARIAHRRAPPPPHL